MADRRTRARYPSPEARLAAARTALRRPAELVGLFLLCAVYLFVYLLEVSTVHSSLNLAGPLALAAILGLSSWRMARASPLVLWSPLFWFRVACAVYCGFGSAVPSIVNAETLEHIHALHYFDAAAHLKLNLVYALGILATLGFSHVFLALRLPGFGRAVPVATGGDGAALPYALLFLLLGGFVRYAIALPYTFGLLSAAVVPGMVLTFAKVFYVGIFLLVFQAARPDGRLRWLAAVLIGVDLVFCVAAFAKTELLLLLLFALLSLLSRKVTLPRALAGACVLLLAYFAFQPLVAYGRAEIEARTGTIRGIGLAERLEIVAAYLGGDRHPGLSGTRQGGLSRLSYVAVGTFVIDRHDAGLPGNTLRHTAAALVPRVLWPEKPVISGLGAELNMAVFGHDRSSLGVGPFAEGYWNFGWPGLVLLTLPLAAILSAATRFSLHVMAAQDWLLLPVVVLGVNMGLRVDGHFVPDIIGPAWIALLLAASAWLVRSAAVRGARARPA